MAEVSETRKEMTTTKGKSENWKKMKTDTVPIAAMNEDLLHNILLRLPAKSFAFASCVNRSWSSVCNRILSRPKMISAFSRNPDQLVSFFFVIPFSCFILVFQIDRKSSKLFFMVVLRALDIANRKEKDC